MVKKRLFHFVLYAAVLVLFCEYGIYYVVIFQCSWPEVPSSIGEHNLSRRHLLKTMFIADTHLLGPVHGHWFDKLRREWQMYRSFKTAIELFNPEVVFFLGDIFDEGQLVSAPSFNDYTSRFHSLFSVPISTRVYVVVGNHDIGFHYRITPLLVNRFENAFNASAVRRIRLKDINFILINSMAMEGDDCFLCKAAVKKIHQISGDLECERYPRNPGCTAKVKTKSYSGPIILQHFPMYRESDEFCTGDDSAPDKETSFRVKLDCLSESSSQYLMKSLQPKLVISGHTHHGCLYHHQVPLQDENVVSFSIIPEYSVPSFSWRNRDNPSFLLGYFTTDDYNLAKCKLPRESSVILLYFFGAMIIFLKTVGFVPRRSRRDILPNLKLLGIGIIILSCTAYLYIRK